MESSTAVPVHERATGSATIADLIGLAAERHATRSGDPPQARRRLAGRQLRGARRDRVRARPRADRPGDRAGRSRRDPLHHASRVDLRRLRHHHRRRGRRPDLPDELAGGVPVGRRQLGVGRDRLRGRDPGREDPAGPRRPAGARDDHRHRPVGRHRRRDPARRRCASAGAARDVAELEERIARGHARPAVHDHLHVGDHRSAEGLRAQPRQLPRRGLDVRARRGRAGRRRRLPLPPARALVRAADPARDPRLGATLAYFGGDPKQIVAGALRGPPDLPAVGPADLREAVHARHRARRPRADQGGDPGRPQGPRARRRPARRCRPSCRRTSTPPRSSCSRTSARRSAANCARPRRAPRRSRRRSSSSSSPAACRCSRATA